MSDKLVTEERPSNDAIRMEKARSLYISGATVEQVARELKCSPNTANKWCKDLIRPVNRRWKSKNEIEVLEDCAVLRIMYGDGWKETFIDIEDAHKLRDLNKTWNIVKFGHSEYVISNKIEDSKRKKVLLHRLLMGEPKGFVIDHINGDTLDNRKSNLRAVTQGQNMQNRNRAKRNGTSGVRGVYYHKVINRWIARITVNKRPMYIGCFVHLSDAEAAVKEARSKFMPYSKEWRDANGA